MKKDSIKRIGVALCILLVVSLTGCGGGGGESTTTSDRQLQSFSKGSAGYYYNPPTLVNNYIYIGTSHKLFRSPANDSHIAPSKREA